jgi:arylsulfatase A-like enzyme
MNVLLIAVDTLRADHLSCYGYARPTSPAMDGLAAQGLRGTNCMAPGIPTHPSFTSLFTGQHPIRHGVLAHGGKQELNQKTPALAELFLERGYNTVAFDNLASGKPYFGRGFETIVDSSKRRGCGLMVTCEEINARLVPFLKQMSGSAEPFFAFVHYWDPHTPYWAPPRYRSLYYRGDPCGPLTLPSPHRGEGNNNPVTLPSPHRGEGLEGLYRHQLGKQWKDTWLKRVLDETQRDPAATIADPEFLVALYDQEIRHVDDGLAQVFETLDETRLAENTLIVLLADHGECMTEHGIYFDHHGLYSENLNVPFLARLPGRIPAGGITDVLLQHTDVLPTLCAACGLRLPENLDGRNAWGLLTTETQRHREDSAWPTELAAAECTWQKKWAFRDARYHFIRAYERDWYGNPLRELYDLTSDPRQTRNIADEKPDVARAMEARLDAWIAAKLKECGRERDPLLECDVTLLRKEGPEFTAETQRTQRDG